MSKEQKSEAEQQQFWQMVIETWKSSGLSIRRFCMKEGLTEASFYSWRKKLMSNDSAPEKQGTPKPSESEFIEVTIPSNSSSAIELVLISGNTLKLPVAVDAKTLTTIISVLHQTQLC